MASGESQKHLLSLIRNIASEKSQEELRVSDLKKRLLELQNDLNVANADLDGAKRSREMAEQELRGSQVQVSMIGASIQAQEARISLLQQEILKLRSDLDALNVLKITLHASALRCMSWKQSTKKKDMIMIRFVKSLPMLKGDGFLHLSWRRYMLLLGRTCRRSAHVQAVDQTTLKTRELKPPELPNEAFGQD
ncbi:hypothetical protein MUK42_09163 [Musa troglodytarum]|uniref:Uncharacterized protein n=1 Tax=Musa troglodytarum TaxID=320322 RepID=A0A9E7HXW7_9LILI|nr:hypothetical protein MUK42_09163 [Musa troglodytarum]